MELPASEIEFWTAYYSIFPFPQEREDARTALLAQVISNMSGRTLKDNYLRKLQDFLPDYLEERSLASQSEARQIEAEKAYVANALKHGLATMEAKDDHST
jgi:hypothetical protein